MNYVRIYLIFSQQEQKYFKISRSVIVLISKTTCLIKSTRSKQEMATAATPDITDIVPSNGHDEDVIMSGFLTKQGDIQLHVC